MVEHARDLISLAMTTDVVQNGKEGEKVNGHEALDLAETVRGLPRLHREFMLMRNVD